jgi:hypothetical protein
MTLYPPEQQVIPNEKNASTIIAHARCAHCGEPYLPNEEQKSAFCCDGCQTVIETIVFILSQYRRIYIFS